MLAFALIVTYCLIGAILWTIALEIVGGAEVSLKAFGVMAGVILLWPVITVVILALVVIGRTGRVP